MLCKSVRVALGRYNVCACSTAGPGLPVRLSVGAGYGGRQACPYQAAIHALIRR
jgi:hypothetical protein